MSEQDVRNATIARIARAVGQLIWLGRKRIAQQFAAYGLTLPQYFTLFFLWNHGQPCSMNTLAELTGQDAATLTGIVDRLVKLGYVKRERGRDDRRKVYVVLQQAGQRVIEQIQDGRHENWHKSLAALGQQDLNDMLRMLETIVSAWSSYPEERGEP